MRMRILTVIGLLVLASISLHADQPKTKVELISVEELKAKITSKQPVTIIDVRSTSSLGNEERIPGAIHVKLRRLRSRLKFSPLKDVPKDRYVVTYCACPGEETSLRAAEVLIEAGFTRVRALKSGWTGWVKAGGPIETPRR